MTRANTITGTRLNTGARNNSAVLVCTLQVTRYYANRLSWYIDTGTPQEPEVDEAGKSVHAGGNAGAGKVSCDTDLFAWYYCYSHSEMDSICTK